jgi:hypothetical protein
VPLTCVSCTRHARSILLLPSLSRTSFSAEKKGAWYSVAHHSGYGMKLREHGAIKKVAISTTIKLSFEY